MSSAQTPDSIAKSSPEESSGPGGATGRTRESLWKRSKRTLGTTQFAFLQGKVAGSEGSGMFLLSFCDYFSSTSFNECLDVGNVGVWM